MLYTHKIAHILRGLKVRNKEIETKVKTLVREIKTQTLSTVDLMETAKFFINEAILHKDSPDRLMATVLIDECWKAIGERN